jgi:glycosyltransferase involved in cell wall biosynthesis
MKKIKVACLLQMFGVGGMPNWLYRLAGELRDEFEFTFVATHSRIFNPEYKKVARVVYVPFNKLMLAAFLRLNRFDIVQTANLRLYVDAARMAKTPVVIERVDGVRSGAALGAKDGVNAVIASTHGIVPYVEKLIPRNRIHLIYNGIDGTALNANRPERFGFAPSDVIIGRTSRLAGGKNISLLIKALIEIKKDPHYQHVKLVICGGDTTQSGSKPMLAQLIKEASPLGKDVVFTGEVDAPNAITAGYDIATCTSDPNNEGIPNSLIEAMAAGKPVVASHVDDVPELVRDCETGILFPAGDLEKLIAALKKLIDQPDLRKTMGIAGRKLVEKEFNLKTQSKMYADLYRRLLKEAGALA